MIVIDPAVVVRYEQAAARDATGYRRKVAAYAIGGDMALMFLQLLPIALVLGIPLLFVNHVLFYWASGIAFVIFAWLMRPSFRAVGRELAEQEAPTLFAELKSLSEKLQVTGRTKVVIDESFNAGAMETRGWFGLVGTTRFLTLGMPLLATLSRGQVMAVIAHEFGHFSRRHGRLGHWVYRARLGWLGYADEHEMEDGVWERAMNWYAQAFVPRFSALSFVHSRQCEYEADADAASVAGAVSIAEALARVHVLGRFWGEESRRVVAAWSRQSSDLPGDYYLRMQTASQAWESEQGEAALALEMAAPTGYVDTHPGLAARMKALGVGAALATPSDVAGAELLGDSWGKLCAEFNRKWQMQNRTDWVARHFYHRLVIAPLSGANDGPKSAMPPSSRLALALDLREESVDAGREALDSLFAEFPGDEDIAFAVGKDRLEAGADDAVAILEALWTRAPIYRKQGAGLLAKHFTTAGDAARAHEWSAKLAATLNSRALVQEQFDTELTSGQASSALMEIRAQEYLKTVLSADVAVVKAYLFHAKKTLVASRGPDGNQLDLYSLWLVLDTAELERQSDTEDVAAERHVSALRKVLRPCDAITARTILTTESLPAELTGKLPVFQR